MNDFIPVTFAIQLLLSVLIYFGSGGQHEIDTDGVEIFRINPLIAWMAAIMSFAISIVLGFAIATAKPTPMDAPLAIMLGECLFFFFGLYGVYCIRMRVRVDSESICVSGLFRKRITHFRDIRSSNDKVTGRYRTLDVINMRGKRILRVTSSFLPDYANLVELLQDGIRKNANRTDR
jgi:hypothetical protein